MVLPLVAVVWAASALAGAWGARESYLAGEAWSEASKVREAAKARFERAHKELLARRDSTNLLLADLGQRRVSAAANELERGIRVVEAVHRVQRGGGARPDRELDQPEVSTVEMRRTTATALDVIKGGGLAVAGGAAGVVGALGLASAVGTASTGTAIASLSGAAATNATLAWLGGGALSAGGAGMAGGTVALAGVFAGPLIGVAGSAARAAAERDRTAAEEDAKVADEAVGAMRLAAAELSVIDSRIDEVAAVLRSVAATVARLCARLEKALARHGWYIGADGTPHTGRVPYTALSATEQADYQSLVVGLRALHQLIEVDVIDELGRPTRESAEVVHSAERFRKDNMI